MKHTGVYIAGKELTPEQLRDYNEVLKKRLAQREARGLGGDNLISKAIRDHIEEYIKILEEMENEERE